MAPFNLSQFLSDQLKELGPTPVVDLTGRVVIVTGGNTGLGYEVVLNLSRLNPSKLIIACRSVEKGEAAAAKIYEANGNKVKPEVWKLDLGDLKQTREFGERCLAGLERLDMLVANAGIRAITRELSKDGYENQLQVNNIAPTLLNYMLLPLMVKSAAKSAEGGRNDFKPHLTTVSSALHYNIKHLTLDKKAQGGLLERMNQVKKFGIVRYDETKAINILNTQTLAQLAGPSIIVNSVAPGYCYSGLSDDGTFPMNMIAKVMKYFVGRTTEVGGKAITWAVLSDDDTGTYSDSYEVREASDYVISEKGKAEGESIFEEMKGIWKDKAGYEA